MKKDSATGTRIWGYRKRLVVSIGSLLLAVFIPLVLYGIITDRNLLRSHFEQTGAYLVKNLALNSELGVFSESVYFLHVPLAAITDKREVVWAAVYDADLNVIKTVGSASAALTLLPHDMRAWLKTADSDSFLSREVSAEAGPVLDFCAPIFLQQESFTDYDFDPEPGPAVVTEVIGVARVGISLAALNERTLDILKAALLLVCIFIGVSCAGIFFIQRSIARPIQNLAEGAREIGRGMLSRRIDVHTRDEIEDLAGEFNHMAGQLQQAVDERLRHEQQRENLLRDIENKNRELESLVYVVSHDLRSPLVNIQGFSQMLRQQVDDFVRAVEKLLAAAPHDSAQREELEIVVGTDIPESVGFIQAGASKMNALLNGLLSVSRTGRAPMTVRAVDTGRLFADILAAQQFQLSDIGATVHLAALPPCHGDEHLLNQVFSNLIGNAIKYRDLQRPLVINISAREKADTVVYSIRDNATGIAPRHLARIWDAFYRVDASLPDSGEGLGLVIVKRIVEKHHGRVWAESEPGRGSVFYVKLEKNMF